MNVLVTGGTGTLGREVVRAVNAAGHRAVTMSRKPAPDAAAAPRWATAHLVTGEGLPAAVADMDAIIHAASDPRGNPAADEEGTRRLAAARAPPASVISSTSRSSASIESRSRITNGSSRPSARWPPAGNRIPSSGLRSSIRSSTSSLGRAATYMPLVMPVPAGYHLQSVGLEDVAARLLRAIRRGAAWPAARLRRAGADDGA